jgi:hypothetical protein
MNPLMLLTTLLKMKAISHTSFALVAPIILGKIVPGTPIRIIPRAPEYLLLFVVELLSKLI